MPRKQGSWTFQEHASKKKNRAYLQSHSSYMMDNLCGGFFFPSAIFRTTTTRQSIMSGWTLRAMDNLFKKYRQEKQETPKHKTTTATRKYRLKTPLVALTTESHSPTTSIAPSFFQYLALSTFHTEVSWCAWKATLDICRVSAWARTCTFWCASKKRNQRVTK